MLSISFSQRAYESGLVLADLLEEEGYPLLGRQLRDVLEEIRISRRHDIRTRDLFAFMYEGLVDVLHELSKGVSR